MSISGIGAIGYPVWYGAGRTENSAKGDFGANVQTARNVVHIEPDTLFAIHDAKTGESAYVSRMARSGKNAEQKGTDSWSFSENTDWVKVVKDIMQSELRYGDMQGYAQWRKFLGFLEK